MKTTLVLATALLLSFAAPVYAGNGPTPINKKDRHELMTKKKKKNKKHGKKKDRKLFRSKESCAGMVN